MESQSRSSQRSLHTSRCASAAVINESFSCTLTVIVRQLSDPTVAGLLPSVVRSAAHQRSAGHFHQPCHATHLPAQRYAQGMFFHLSAGHFHRPCHSAHLPHKYMLNMSYSPHTMFFLFRAPNHFASLAPSVESSFHSLQFMSAFRYDAHPMGMVMSALAALGTFYPEQVCDYPLLHMPYAHLVARNICDSTYLFPSCCMRGLRGMLAELLPGGCWSRRVQDCQWWYRGASLAACNATTLAIAHATSLIRLDALSDPQQTDLPCPRQDYHHRGERLPSPHWQALQRPSKLPCRVVAWIERLVIWLNPLVSPETYMESMASAILSVGRYGE